MLKKLTYLLGIAIACVAIDSTSALAWGGKKTAAPATAGASTKIKCPSMFGGAGTCTAAYCSADPAHFKSCDDACGKGNAAKNIKACNDAHLHATGAPVAVVIKCPSMLGGAGTCIAKFCEDSVNYAKCDAACGKGKPEKNIKACYTSHMNKGGQNAVAHAQNKDKAHRDAIAKKKAAEAAAKAKAEEEAAAAAATETPAETTAEAPAADAPPADAPPPEEAPAEAPPADAPPPEEAPAEAPPADAPPPEEAPAEAPAE